MTRTKGTWIKPKIDAEVMRKLTKRNDILGALQLVSQISLVVCLGVVTYWAFKALPLYVGVILIYIYGYFYSFLAFGAAFHELSHRTVFKSKRVNDFFFVLTGIMGWQNGAFFRKSHTAHHMHTVFSGMDQEVVLPYRFKPFEWLFAATFHFRKCLIEVIPTVIRQALGIIDGEWERQLFEHASEKDKAALRRNARIILAVQILLMAVFIYFQQWLLILMVNFGTFIAMWGHMVVGITQHMGMEPNTFDFRKSCRTVKLNPFLGYLYWQMQYHIEHHMYPGVPFYNLKKLRKEIEDFLPPRSKNLIEVYTDLIEYRNQSKKIQI